MHARSLVLALCLALGACHAGAALTADEVKSHGVVILKAAPPKAYKAALEALKSIGYEISAEDPARGIIVTKRRPMPDLSVINNASFSKQYTIEVSDLGGASRVTATPALFNGELDVSTQRVWDLEGALGERELWRQLFAKIEQLL